MRRNLTLLLMTPLWMAACNSITGTRDTSPPVANVPIENCIDDFRAVHILPESSEIQAGNCLHISWAVIEFCSTWESLVRVYVDGVPVDTPWCPVWSVDLGGTAVFVRNSYVGSILTVTVAVRDLIGEVSDTHRYRIVPGSRPRIPQQRD